MQNLACRYQEMAEAFGMWDILVRCPCELDHLRGVPTYFREGVLKRKVDSLAGGLGGAPSPDADDNMAVTLPQITIILL